MNGDYFLTKKESVNLNKEDSIEMVRFIEKKIANNFKSQPWRYKELWIQNTHYVTMEAKRTIDNIKQMPQNTTLTWRPIQAKEYIANPIVGQPIDALFLINNPSNPSVKKNGKPEQESQLTVRKTKVRSVDNVPGEGTPTLKSIYQQKEWIHNGHVRPRARVAQMIMATDTKDIDESTIKDALKVSNVDIREMAHMLKTAANTEKRFPNVFGYKGVYRANKAIKILKKIYREQKNSPQEKSKR